MFQDRRFGADLHVYQYVSQGGGSFGESQLSGLIVVIVHRYRLQILRLKNLVALQASDIIDPVASG